MALYAKDIMQFFHDAANWLTQRCLHVDIVIDGGCALVLQTGFRETARDVDMRVGLALAPHGFTGPHTVFSRLQAQFGSTYSIDNHYGPKFMDLEMFDSRCEARTKPFLALVNDTHFGATFHLATLDYILELKTRRLMKDMSHHQLDKETLEKDINDVCALNHIFGNMPPFELMAHYPTIEAFRATADCVAKPIAPEQAAWAEREALAFAERKDTHRLG